MGDGDRQVGRYRLIRLLGEGGQGEVHLGLDPEGRKVAVKLLKPFAGKTARDRFVKEAEAALRVPQFCTARVLDFAAGPPDTYMVSEYVPGRSLQEEVTARGALSGAALKRLVLGTITALHAIHRAGVVHRDFKPANVMLGPHGPQVIDFGIAKALNGPDTQASGLIGTPAYMSPEQIRQKRLSDRSDVFSWGSTMVFAATGRSPFAGVTHAVSMNRVLQEEPDLTGIRPPLLELLRGALAKDPDARPTSAQLLMALLVPELGTGAARRTALADPVSAMVEAARISAVRSRVERTIWWAASAVAVIVAIAAASVIYVLQGREAGSRTAPQPGFGVQIGQPLQLGYQPEDIQIVSVGGATQLIASERVALQPTDKIHRYDLATGNEIGAPLTRASEQVLSFAVTGTADKPVLATGSLTGRVRLFDLTSGDPVGEFDAKGPVSVHPGSLDGRPIVITIGGQDDVSSGAVEMWDTASLLQIGGTVTTLGEATSAEAFAVEDSGNGSLILLQDREDTVLWSLSNRAKMPRYDSDPALPNDGRGLIPRAAGIADGRPVAILTSNKTTTLWDLDDRKERGQLPDAHEYLPMTFGQVNGRPVIVGADSAERTKVWDLGTLKPLGEPFAGQLGGLGDVAFGQLGGNSVAVTATGDGSTRLWSLGPPYPSEGAP